MGIFLKAAGVVTSVTLSLYASSAFAGQPDAISRLDGYRITEFTPETQPDKTCVTSYYGARLAMDCFEKSAEKGASATLDAAYTADGYSITEFTPKTAPDMGCVISYYGSRSDMTCLPKQKGPQ